MPTIPFISYSGSDMAAAHVRQSAVPAVRIDVASYGAQEDTMISPRRTFLLRSLALAPRWPVGVLPDLPLAGSGLAALALTAPMASYSAPAAALDGAPFFSAALAQAVGGSMVSAEWRGDYAQAARLADADVERARASALAPALVDALLSRAAVALLAGNAGQARTLLEEAARGAANDALRKVWLEAYGYAAHVRSFGLLPGGSLSIGEELTLRAGKMRLAPHAPPEAEAANWVPAEYFWASLRLDRALSARDPSTSRLVPEDMLTGPPYTGTPAALRVRVMVVEADALRRRGRRSEALPALVAARAAYAQARDAAGVLATEVLEGDWFAAPLSTPEELNFHGRENTSDWWETEELDSREVDVQRAREAYERAEVRAKALRAPRALAALALRRGVLARVDNDLAAAEASARQAMNGFEACGDRSGYWTARWHAALARAASGQPAQDPEAAPALARWARAEGSFSHAFGLGLIAERAARHVLLRQGSPESAVTVGRLTEALFAQLRAWVPLARACQQRASVQSTLGDYVGRAHALAAAADAVERRVGEQQNQPSLEASAMLATLSSAIMGNAFGNLRDPALIEQAAALVTRYASRIADGAAALRRRNWSAEYIATLEVAAAETREWLLPVPGHIACLRGMEELHSGEPADAQKQFDIVVAAADATGGNARLRHHLLTLVFVLHRARRNYPAAAAAAQSSFEIAGQVVEHFENQLSKGVAAANVEARQVLRAQGLKQAHELAFSELVSAKSFDAAAQHLVALEQLGGPEWWRASNTSWISRADCARLQEGQGQLEQAAGLYSEAIALLESRRNQLRADVLKVSLASNRPAADLYLDAAHNALKTMIRASDAASQGRLGNEAFDHIERVKARGLLDLLGGNRAYREARAAGASSAEDDVNALLRSWQRSQMSIATWQSLLVNDASSSTAAARRQAFLQQRITEESARMAQLDQALAARARNTPQLAQPQSTLLNPDQVARLLSPGTVLLQMALLDDDLLLCTVSASGSVIWHKAAVDAVGLQRDMRLLRRLCEHRGAQREFDERALRIAKVLLDPISAIIAAHQQIVVVPHGAAYTLPFAALPWRGAPLCEHVAVTQIPSASVLPFLLRTAPALKSSVLAVGNPARMAYKAPFDLNAQPWRALPGAEAEAAAVADGFAGSKVLTGAAATAAAVRNELPRHRILHLATHGVLSESAPMLSSLLLADGEALTVDDLMGLRLNADLVVLSACNTGAGKESSGNDVSGFTRGLLVAGARSVIVSLWPVNDAATRLLMEHFYAELRRGQTSAAALRSAQLALRGMAATGTGGVPSPDYRHPHYWAAFVLVG